MTAPASALAALRSMFVDVFGCTSMRPMTDLEVFVFGDGSKVGVYTLSPNDALAPAQHERAGTWIEIRVDDPDGTGARLEGIGARRLGTADREHAYYQVPGGQVLRLAVSPRS